MFIPKDQSKSPTRITRPDRLLVVHYNWFVFYSQQAIITYARTCSNMKNMSHDTNIFDFNSRPMVIIGWRYELWNMPSLCHSNGIYYTIMHLAFEWHFRLFYKEAQPTAFWNPIRPARTPINCLSELHSSSKNSPETAEDGKLKKILSPVVNQWHINHHLMKTQVAILKIFQFSSTSTN